MEADYKTQSLQYSPLTLPPVPPHSRQDEARAAAVLGAPSPRRRPALLQPRAPAAPPDLAPAQGPGTEAGTQRPQAGLQAQTRQIQAPRQVQVRLEYIQGVPKKMSFLGKTAITTFKIIQNAKAGGVLENSGYLLPDEH